MRIAIISDIHANLEALTSAIRLIDAEGVDDIVCLGDVVGYGANPNECAEIVRERCRFTLLGNHDAAALDPRIADEHFTNAARVSAHWTERVLNGNTRAFLNDLPLVQEWQEIQFVHASPFRPGEWYYLESAADAAEAFGHFTQKLCFVGHTHVPMILSEALKPGPLSRTSRFIINPGSVGQPRDGDPRLAFGLLDVEHWTYRQMRGKYNNQEARRKIIDAGLPGILGDRLLKGM